MNSHIVKKHGHSQSRKSRLAAQRNWAQLQRGGIISACDFLRINNWISMKTANQITAGAIRASIEIDDAWENAKRNHGL